MLVDSPTLIDAFYQANLIDGYGFLDVRGALIRQFHANFKNTNEVVENDWATMHFLDPVISTQPVAEMKISVPMVWIHFQSSADRVAIRQEAARIVDRACSLIGSTRFARQGLRVHQLFAAPTIEVAVAALRSMIDQTAEWGSLGDTTGGSLHVDISRPRLKASIRISSVRRVRIQARILDGGAAVADQGNVGEDAGPRFGILLDADLYDDAPSDTRDPKPHLNRAIEFLDDELVPFVGRLLEAKA